MDRWVYRSITVAAALLATFLLALPIWDHWYYGTRRIDAPQAAMPSSLPYEPGAPPATTPMPGAHIATQFPLAMASFSYPTRPETRLTGASKPSSRASAPLSTERAVGLQSAVPSGASHVPRAQTGTATMTLSATAVAKSPAVPPSPVQKTKGPAYKAPDASRIEAAGAGMVLAFAPPAALTANGQAADQDRGSVAPSGDHEVGGASSGQDNPRPQEAQEAAPQLALIPSNTVIAAGETLIVKLTLIGGRDISSAPFHLSFNPEVLEFVAAREGSAFRSTSLAPVLLAGVNPDRPGDLAVGLSMIGSAGLLNTSGDLLDLEFRAVGKGESKLLLDRASLRGARGETLPVEFFSSSVNVR